MDDRRFDSLVQLFAARRSRRTALKGGFAGASALAIRGLTELASPAGAQDATPEVSPEADAPHPSFLFVQLAEGGTWIPKPGEDGVYLLTLAGVSSQSIYFSDRPKRIVGTVPTEKFLDQLGFTPLNPPNAAVVVQTPEGTRDVLVIELFDPVYTQDFADGAGDVLTYEARLLEAYEGDGLTPWVGEMDDDELPQAFTEVSLFIDDCAPIEWCYNPIGGTANERIGPVPWRPYARCYNFFRGCIVCEDSAFSDSFQNELNRRCNAYSDCTSRNCFAL